MEAMRELQGTYFRFLLQQNDQPLGLNDSIKMSDCITTWLQRQGDTLNFSELSDELAKLQLTAAFNAAHRDLLKFGFSQPLFLNCLKRILSGAEQADLKMPYPVLVGEFPTHEMNGCIIRVNSGALILVNSALDHLLSRLTKIIAAYCMPNTSDDGTRWEDIGHERASRERTVLALVNSLLSYFFTNELAGMREYQIPGQYQWALSHLLTQDAISFVIAHELGHAILGHLDSRKSGPEIEKEADDAAVALLDHIRRVDLEGAPAKTATLLTNFTRQGLLAAPFVFFSISTLVEEALRVKNIRALHGLMSRLNNVNRVVYVGDEVRHARSEHDGITHPSAAERLNRIQQRVVIDRPNLKLGLSYAAAVNELMSDVLSRLNTHADALLQSAAKIAREHRLKHQ
jgi:hypothetical protein